MQAFLNIKCSLNMKLLDAGCGKLPIIKWQEEKEKSTTAKRTICGRLFLLRLKENSDLQYGKWLQWFYQKINVLFLRHLLCLDSIPHLGFNYTVAMQCSEWVLQRCTKHVLSPLEASTISLLSIQMNVRQFKILHFKDLSVLHCNISKRLQM